MVDRRDIEKLLKGAIERFDEACASYNPSSELKKRSWDVPMGRLDGGVSRGEVFEKASSIYCDLEIETPPKLAEDLGQKGTKAQVLVLEFHFFPVSPFVPKGYIELRANITDKVALAGGTDVRPYLQKEDDITYFADEMKKLCDRHGKDYEELRQTRANFWQSKYSKAKIGSHVGIYSFHLEEEDFPFFTDINETFFKSYFEIVDRRKGEPFTEEERDVKLKIHGYHVCDKAAG